MRYLLDELETYENDYTDLLAPTDYGHHESLAGEAAALAPLPGQEVRAQFERLVGEIKTLGSWVRQLQAKMDTLANAEDQNRSTSMLFIYFQFNFPFYLASILKLTIADDHRSTHTRLSGSGRNSE